MPPALTTLFNSMSEAGKAFSSKSNTTDPWGSSLNPAWTSCRVEQDNKKNTQLAVRRKLLTGNRAISSWFSKFAAIIAPFVFEAN
jgi:hypothetical protein